LTKQKKSSIITIEKRKREIAEMRKFFGINEKYKFEMNDLRAGIQILNVLLIILFGLSVSWFGLTVAVCGIVKDLTKDRKINGLLMHTATAILNIYFLKLLYFG
jgi:hypothetical protein